MSWKALAILLILAMVFNLSVINQSSGQTSKIIIYGTHRCSACSGLKQFFDDIGLPYEFREIYDCKLSGCELTTYGLDLAKIINIAGLEAYIPVSIVIDDNGFVTAIVQGKNENKTFWNKLLSERFRCGIEIYTYGKVGEIKDPGNISEIIKIVTGENVSKSKIESLLKLCSTNSTTKSKSTSSTTTIGKESEINWQLLIPGITLAIIAGSIILYFITKKRG
ncbi:MAG: hypothetical protein DRO40_02675 [Thermoprotei archaeon]|nr:MAG: hypothetical protein DRO40_02675 [Thermoprotei archaeon]